MMKMTQVKRRERELYRRELIYKTYFLVILVVVADIAFDVSEVDVNHAEVLYVAC